MPKATLDTIYFQGISSTMIYGILTLGNCAAHLLASVEALHIQAARFIHHKKKVTNVFVLKSTLIFKGKIIFIVS